MSAFEENPMGETHTAKEIQEGLERERLFGRRKGCPLLVQNDTNASMTIPGESHSRSYFLECLGEKCAAFNRNGICGRFGTVVLTPDEIRSIQAQKAESLREALNLSRKKKEAANGCEAQFLDD